MPRFLIYFCAKSGVEVTKAWIWIYGRKRKEVGDRGGKESIAVGGRSGVPKKAWKHVAVDWDLTESLKRNR